MSQLSGLWEEHNLPKRILLTYYHKIQLLYEVFITFFIKIQKGEVRPGIKFSVIHESFSF